MDDDRREPAYEQSSNRRSSRLKANRDYLIARNVYPLESEVHTGNGRRGGRSRRGGRGNRGRRPLLSSSPMSGRSIDNNQRGTLIFVYIFFCNMLGTPSK